MPLLPPRVVGPITPVAGAVLVEHVLPEASVEIHVDGVPTGHVATASSSAVHVSVGTLTPGSTIQATWSLGGETSAASPPQVVIGYPAHLAAPVYLSPVHTAMDWVELGALYPGATVTLRDSSGSVVGGPDTVGGAVGRVRVTDWLTAGDRLYAEQSVNVPGTGVVAGDKAMSLPVEGWYDREEQPPVPVVVPPVRECATAVLVGGAVHGCTVFLDVSGEVFPYDAVGETFWAVLPRRAEASDSFAAVNVLRRLGRESGPSAPVTVDPAAPLETPRLQPDTQYCPSLVAVDATRLEPGAELTLDLRGAAGSSALFRTGAPDGRRHDSYVFGDLSAHVPQAPPFPAVVLGERLCALSAESNRAGVHRRAGAQEVPPAFFSEPRECATALHVLNAWGTFVSVHSDAADWPLLASWVLVPTTGWVPLNRALRAGEEVWVRVEQGCVPAHRTTSDRVTVLEADLDALRVVEPLRPGRTRTVYLEDPVPGGRVHVYVNGRWRWSAQALPTPGQAWAEVYVGELGEEDVVTAFQSLCGRTSEETPGVPVLRGEIALDASVGSLVRGVPTSLTVRAFDRDTGQELGGLRVRGSAGDVGWVGQQFTVTATGSAPSLRLSVDAEGYDQGVLDLPVVAPAPPPAQTLTIRSQVALGAHVAVQSISEITWTLTGPNAPPAQSQSPGAVSCQFTFAIPTPGGGSAVWYRLTGSATIAFVDPGTGLSLTRPVATFSTIGGLRDWLDVEWRGQASWREINIAWRPIYQDGVHVDSVFCFVLAADG